MPAAIFSVSAPLAPGEADPRMPISAALSVSAPLRPGESLEDAHDMPAVQGPAKPGDGEPDEYIVRAPRCLGPGDIQVPQPVQRVKRKGA